jgi:hypothetical protein
LAVQYGILLRCYCTLSTQGEAVMTDPLCELLRKIRELNSFRSNVDLMAEIDAALVQQPLGTLATNDDPSYSRATNEALQPEPVAHALTSEFDKLKDPDCLSISVLMFRHGSRLNPTTAIYAVPPSAAALIAEKDAEIEQLKERSREWSALAEEEEALRHAAERALAQIKEEKAVACPHGVLYPHECRDCQERLGKIELAVIRVCGELRDEAHERRQSDKEAGMFPDEHTAQMLTEWANRLELANTHLLEDIYEQCCEAIKPLVDTGKLPASLVESVQEMAKLYAAPQSPAASNQENAGRKTRQPEETRGLLGASELSGDGHQIDDPQQVGPQPPAGKSQEPQGFNFEAADGEEGD